MKNNEKMTSTGVVCFLALVCCGLWGSAFPFIKIGYIEYKIAPDDTPSQILFAGIRFTIAGLMVIVFTSLMKRKISIPKNFNQVRQIGIVSLFQTILQYFFYYIGLANTPAVRSAIIIGTNVFTAVIISALLFKLEKLTLNKIFGCAVGFVGILIMNLSGVGIGQIPTLKGDGMVFLSTIAYAFSSVVMKKFSSETDPIMLSGWQFLFGGLVMSILGKISGGELPFLTFSNSGVLAYLAFISAGAYSLWSLLLKYNPVSRVAVYGFMNPVFGVILSALMINGERDTLGIQSIISLFLVCMGIYMVNKSSKSIG